MRPWKWRTPTGYCRKAIAAETILTSANQIATPALVATLAICIVFVPIMFSEGDTGIPVPAAGGGGSVCDAGVVFAVANAGANDDVLLLSSGADSAGEEEQECAARTRNFRKFHGRFEEGFDKLRERYALMLEWCLHRRALFTMVFMGFCLASLALLPLLGSDLFPYVDAGQIRLHFRAPTGLRIEETAALCQRVEAAIREEIPASEVNTVLDNIGMPYSGINLTYSNSGVIGTSDAEILVSLNQKHRPSLEYMRDLRGKLPKEFPGTQFFFQPADIVGQILNFGLPSPIDIQLVGMDMAGNFKVRTNWCRGSGRYRARRMYISSKH